MPTKTSYTDFPRLLVEIEKGRLPLPNFEPLDLGRAVAILACAGAVAITDVKWVKLEGEQHSQWARLLLNYTQAGVFDGTGIAFLYHSGQGLAGRFAICKHEIVADPGARPSRGWHPSHCTLCGLNTSVDSGD